MKERDRQIDRQINRQTDRQIDRQLDRQIERQIGRQVGRQSEKEREIVREINHLSLHQWLRSAIPDSQQPTSPIGFLFLKLPPPPCAVLLVHMDVYWYLYIIIYIPNHTYLPKDSTIIAALSKRSIQQMNSNHRLSVSII